MTKPKPESTPDDAEQSKRFVDMAREIESSESEEDAKRAFKKVVGPKKVAQPKSRPPQGQ